MTSVVALIMSISAILTITSGSVIQEFPGSNIVKDMCPQVGFTAAEYQVSVITAMTLDSPQIGGCGLIDFKSTGVLKKSFSVWLGSLNNGMQRCREKDMEQFNFSCQSETSLPESEEFMKGVMFGQVFGRVNNNEDKSSIRCAIHDMVKSNATTFRMAVSGDNSCHGLADLLQSNLQTTFPDGAMVLQLRRSRLLSNQIRV
ncbi:PREDICTED: uncharacterized protein LOC107168898 [Diuraphis noxia]|uniref:uncharacterized protein LOC107168898 n=1 Tax=Diuraphis noxia TaxID=143948 RepID=UPI000763814D|nr:PREDICTED: uncharacterized protein LOC107168898 [Diuraphis noxia]